MIPLIRRREPRVLALDANAVTIAFVVADIHELRSSGDDPAGRRSQSVLLRRLIRRERPTVIVSAGKLPKLAPSILERIPLLPAPPRLLPFESVTDGFPEAAAFAPNRRLERLARIAVTTLIRGSVPSHRYAKHPRRPTPVRPDRAP